MKKCIYYPPGDIKDVASIYESEVDNESIYLYRRVPIEEILEYYIGKKAYELDEQGRLLLFIKKDQEDVTKEIESYWEGIRELFHRSNKLTSSMLQPSPKGTPSNIKNVDVLKIKK